MTTEAMERRFGNAMIHGVASVLLCAGLAACTSPLLQVEMKKEPDLRNLLEAYRTQSARAQEQRQQRLERGIRTLAVAKGPAPEAALVTVDLENASLSVVVRSVLDQTGAPYLVQDIVVGGTVSARFEKVPLINALNLLLGSQGLVARLESGLVIIGDPPPAVAAALTPPPGTPGAPPLAPPTPMVSRALTPPPGTPGAPLLAPPTPMVSRALPLQQFDTGTALKFLDGLYPVAPATGKRDVHFSAQPYTNTMFLLGAPEQVARAARMLRQLDRDPSHVVIEALVVEYDSDAFERLGADIQNFAKGETSALTSNVGSLTQRTLTFTRTSGATNVLAYTALIDVLVSQEKARVISRPYVATLSGRQATINITRDRYVIVQTVQQGATVTTPQAVQSGVLLTITPTVSHDGGIRMEVYVEESDFIPTQDNIAVEVDKNKAQTTMRVESGETIIIGGLVLNRESRSNAGLPWLRHIPLLNLVFAEHEAKSTKQEVVILVTPHIWTPGMTPPLVESEAFTVQEPKDLFSPLERFNK